jgi:hypothetical protein
MNQSSFLRLIKIIIIYSIIYITLNIISIKNKIKFQKK